MSPVAIISLDTISKLFMVETAALLLNILPVRVDIEDELTISSILIIFP
jgi:hypothetical protein